MKASIRTISIALAAACCLLLAACSEDSQEAGKPDAAGEATQRDSGQHSASEFCDAYEARCGFGRDHTFADREDCEEDFADKFNQARKQCAASHLERAAGDPAGHCEAAKGDAVCRSP